MHRFTGESRWYDLALDLADTIFEYAVERPEGIAFPGRYFLRLSTDFGTGTAGAGAFLTRLATRAPRLFHDLGTDEAAPAAVPAHSFATTA